MPVASGAQNRRRPIYGVEINTTADHRGDAAADTAVWTILPPPRRLCNARCLSVCPSVCLQLYVKLSNISSLKFFHRCIPGHGKLIKFWKSSASGSGCGNFLKDSLTFRDKEFFHNSAHISAKKNRSNLNENRCIFRQGSVIKFCKSSGS